MAELTCKVDFLECTVPASRFYELLTLLGSDLQPLERGWRGYTSSGVVAGGFGRLGWNDEPARAAAMGVHCSLGAQALAYLAGQQERWADLGVMLSVLRRDLGGHVTRLDVAWDDKTEQVTGVLDVDLVRDEVKAGHFTSRWKGGHGRWGWGNQDGETVYFGSGSSDAMLRVYNKRLERIAKGHADQVEGVGHWQRVELQLRRERADAAAELFQGVTRDRARTMRTLAGILRGYLDFKVPSSTDTNRRRWVTAPWWAAFLGFVEKCKLVVERVRRTVETVKAWLSSCAGPSLALVQEALGVVAGRAWLAETVDQGRARWGAKHRAILAASGLAVPAGAAFGG